MTSQTTFEAILQLPGQSSLGKPVRPNGRGDCHPGPAEVVAPACVSNCILRRSKKDDPFAATAGY
jgi:hypothetical protein